MKYVWKGTTGSMAIFNPIFASKIEDGEYSSFVEAEYRITPIFEEHSIFGKIDLQCDWAQQRLTQDKISNKKVRAAAVPAINRSSTARRVPQVGLDRIPFVRSFE